VPSSFVYTCSRKGLSTLDIPCLLPSGLEDLAAGLLSWAFSYHGNCLLTFTLPGACASQFLAYHA